MTNYNMNKNFYERVSVDYLWSVADELSGKGIPSEQAFSMIQKYVSQAGDFGENTPPGNLANAIYKQYKEGQKRMKHSNFKRRQYREASKPNIEDMYTKLFSISEDLNNIINVANEIATSAEAFGGVISDTVTSQMREFLIPNIAKLIDNEKTPGSIANIIKFLDSVPLSATRNPPDPVSSVTSMNGSPIMPFADIPEEANMDNTEEVEEKPVKESRTQRSKMIQRNQRQPLSILEMASKPASRFLREQDNNQDKELSGYWFNLGPGKDGPVYIEDKEGNKTYIDTAKNENEAKKLAKDNGVEDKNFTPILKEVGKKLRKFLYEQR